MVRWDSPLITVPWTDEDVPADDIWKAVTEGNVKPPNAGTQAVSIFTRLNMTMPHICLSVTSVRFPRHPQTHCGRLSQQQQLWSQRSWRSSPYP